MIHYWRLFKTMSYKRNIELDNKWRAIFSNCDLWSSFNNRYLFDGKTIN